MSAEAITMERRFQDRFDGGRQLAPLLADLALHRDTVVLALPTGGVPVGIAVAREPRLPLDVVLVHRLSLPGQEELAMGTIASGGNIVLNDDIVTPLGI